MLQNRYHRIVTDLMKIETTSTSKSVRKQKGNVLFTQDVDVSSLSKTKHGGTEEHIEDVVISKIVTLDIA